MKFKYCLACSLLFFMSSCKKYTKASVESPVKVFPPTGNPPDSSYHLIFNDQFNTNNIDNNGQGWWTSRTAPAEARGFTGYNRASNNIISNGVLSIKFEKDPDGKYYGGGIISRMNFGYGYYEAKVKLYTGSYGLHQSFWSFGTSIEIDGFEFNSKTKNALSTLIPGRWRWKPSVFVYKANTAEQSKFVSIPNTNLSDTKLTDESDWIVVGYEWLPDRINYYVNGILRNTYPLIDSFGQDLNVFQPGSVFLTALPYKEYIEIDLTGDPKPGAKMQIEYFNYYAKRLPNTNLLGNNEFSYVTDINKLSEPTATAWSDSPLKVNNIITYGKTGADADNSNVIKEGSNWFLEQKNTTQNYTAETYQTLNYLLPGTYKLSADIRCSGAGSKLIVLDKDKLTVLYSKTILSQEPAWVTITSDDIRIKNDQVTILIYSDSAKGAYFQVDNVKFALKQ